MGFLINTTALAATDTKGQRLKATHDDNKDTSCVVPAYSVNGSTDTVERHMEVARGLARLILNREPITVVMVEPRFSGYSFRVEA